MRKNEDRFGTQFQNNDLPAELINEQDNQKINFINPTEFVVLPSRGKFYKSNFALKNKDTIEIKQMTAKEEDLLTNRSLLKKGVALERLLESVILDKSFNANDLLICDRNAILVAARISGYGSDYETSFDCPSCEKKVKHLFNLDEKVEESEKEEVATETDEDGNFFVTLPQTKWKIVCRALNGHDEKKMINATVNKTREEFTLLDQFKMMIVSIQNVTDRKMIEQAIEAMPAADSKYLRKVYESHIPSLNLKNTFICKYCDHEEVVEVPLTTDFFWPKQ